MIGIKVRVRCRELRIDVGQVFVETLAKLLCLERTMRGKVIPFADVLREIVQLVVVILVEMKELEVAQEDRRVRRVALVVRKVKNEFFTRTLDVSSPIQTVISGSVAGVEKAREVLKAMGAKRVVNLPVSAPFHCSLMKPAAEALRERLAGVSFAAPRIALVNNVDVAVQTDADAIRNALYRQAFGPVRWVEVVQALRARGLGTIVECGPGKVLAGMAWR